MLACTCTFLFYRNDYEVFRMDRRTVFERVPVVGFITGEPKQGSIPEGKFVFSLRLFD